MGAGEQFGVLVQPLKPARLWRLVRRSVMALVLLLATGFAATRVLIARAERTFPPLGSFVVVEGLRQHYVERGAGPPIVFVHGAFGGSQDFAATILDDAARRYRCIAWDRPGHGYSERSQSEVIDPGVQARILLGLVRELRLKRPLLVGFSYGSAVVLAAALDQPDAIHGAVLLNGPSHVWPDPTELVYRMPAVPLLGTLLTETVTTPLGHLLANDGVANAFAPLAVGTSFASSPIALALRPASYRANAEDLRSLKPFLADQVHRYAGLRVPVTMVVAEGDRVVSPHIHSRQLARASSRVELVHIPGAGHQILYTHAARVLAIIDGARR